MKTRVKQNLFCRAFYCFCEGNEHEPVMHRSLYLCPLPSVKSFAAETVSWRSFVDKIWFYFTCRSSFTRAVGIAKCRVATLFFLFKLCFTRIVSLFINSISLFQSCTCLNLILEVVCKHPGDQTYLCFSLLEVRDNYIILTPPVHMCTQPLITALFIKFFILGDWGCKELFGSGG